ncbi:MAG: DoxX family protein [Candidatus Nomurabacteria bacterium GW2011_GWA1_46_11]|uniref:DoxX family protein n=1 Tax=Candidatus Nomurabacteria bacterium GW2011_GWA1_46_11 TaxID=1618732 RepID=A0A0G1NKU5_9BACT|nr:MAG: DoxX family protein [Candidatus Nomurabacteria bacterium GW2011_GWA1_46_11]
MSIKKITWLALRLVMSLIFLWAFADKLLGLGFATTKEGAWLNGGSPTAGFLLKATRGPLAEFFQELAGVSLVDWLFMLGLLFAGAALLLNRFVVWGAMAGGIIVLLIYLAAFPPANNPLLDEHVVYILVLILLASRGRDRL